MEVSSNAESRGRSSGSESSVQIAGRWVRNRARREKASEDVLLRSYIDNACALIIDAFGSAADLFCQGSGKNVICLIVNHASHCPKELRHR